MSDTSTVAAGAALYQYQGSAFYIVGYNSKKLPAAAQNYSVTELELIWFSHKHLCFHKSSL